MTVSIVAYLVLGVGLGVLYFSAVWWSVRRFTGGMAVLVAVVARFAVLAAALALVSREGAVPLLAAAAGLMAGRFLVLHRVRGMPA